MCVCVYIASSPERSEKNIVHTVGHLYNCLYSTRHPMFDITMVTVITVHLIQLYLHNMTLAEH